MAGALLNNTATVSEAQTPLVEQLQGVVQLLRAHEDILAERPSDAAAPSWAQRRGWSDYLRRLGPAVVARCEAGDAAAALAEQRDAPPGLRELAAASLAACRLPLSAHATPHARSPLANAGPQKRDQIEALAALAPRSVARVVDFGAGRGHLTRRLSEVLDVPALGLERRADVVQTARNLAPTSKVRFESAEVGGGFEARPDDLLVGLHACGELGDALIRSAVRSGAAVLLVPCCPQKIGAEVRAPLSAHGLPLARPLLGLANLAGVSRRLPPDPSAAEHSQTPQPRRTRLALRLLLESAGVALGPGEETRGINRKRFRSGLGAVAPQAFEKRGLPVPGQRAIAAAEQRAIADYARLLRFSLPRRLLARPLELAVTLDRAAALAQAGGPSPRVLQAFGAVVSPRNVVVVRPAQPSVQGS